MDSSSNTNVGTWLSLNTKKLQEAGIESARLDCLILLEHQLGKNRALLLAHPEEVLIDADIAQLAASIKKRAAHTPLAYITERTEFYGRAFFVSPDVLIPRPESEDIFSLFTYVHDAPRTILDVGTGSGALAITAKSFFPDTNVYALDCDTKCLAVAAKNAEINNLDIYTLQSDLLKNIPHDSITGSSIILANLPYVPDSYPVNQAAMHEPALALYGGQDGLDLYRRLFQQLQLFDTQPQAVICESLESQHEDLASLAAAHGFALLHTAGLQQLFVPRVRAH